MNRLFSNFEDLKIDISNEERNNLKELVEKNIDGEIKDKVFFELDKQYINIGVIESLLCEVQEKHFPPINEKISYSTIIITGIINFLGFILVNNSILTLSFISKTLDPFLFSILSMINTFFISGMITNLKNSDKNNKFEEKYLKNLYFKENVLNFFLKKDEVKIKILNIMKEKINEIVKITYDNKKALRLMEDSYYNVEEALISNKLINCKTKLKSFFDLANNYEDIYSKADFLNKTIKLEMNY